MTTLADALRAEGGLLAAAVAAGAPPVPDDAAAAIREGERVHFGGARVVATEDDDLAILAGDHLYALGLSRLAAARDLDGVARLAAIIARCAQAHAEDRPQDAAAAWEAL